MRSGKYRRRTFWAVLLFTSLQGTVDSRPGDLPHDAYVWQRHWTPAVVAAIRQSADRVRGFRVLAAEMDGTGELSTIDADRSALLTLGHPVTLVVRINGQIPEWSHDAVADRAMALIEEWQQRGLRVSGLEIDHDCGTARLAAYARFLERLSGRRPPELTLSITALPAWLESPLLRRVLAHVDEAVLQVHSVIDPRHGLFDDERAAEWVGRWSRMSPVPFRVALPTYGSRVTWHRDGRLASVESEASRLTRYAEGRELMVSPAVVARFVDRLERHPPRRLTGLAWFRLPTSDDRRAWSLATFHAVLDGRWQGGETTADVRASDLEGTMNVFVTNRGVLDDVLPDRIELVADGGCEASDALAPYHESVSRPGITTTFALASPWLLPAGGSRLVAWVRCSSGQEGIHVRLQ